jgi:hypothetical protein
MITWVAALARASAGIELMFAPGIRRIASDQCRASGGAVAIVPSGIFLSAVNVAAIINAATPTSGASLPRGTIAKAISRPQT